MAAKETFSSSAGNEETEAAEAAPKQSRRGRTIGIVVGVAAIGALGVAGAFGVFGSPGDSADGNPAEQVAQETEPRKPEPVDATLGDLSEASAEQTEVAEQTVATFLELEAAAFSNPEQAPDMSPVLTGAALEEYNVSVAQMVAEGTRQEGSAQVAAVEVLESSTEQLKVQVCVDSSAVRTFTTDGAELTNPDAPKRSAMLLTFLREGEGWRMSQSSFPENPDC